MTITSPPFELPALTAREIDDLIRQANAAWDKANREEAGDIEGAAVRLVRLVEDRARTAIAERDAWWQQQIEAPAAPAPAPDGWVSVEDRLPPANPANDANSQPVLFWGPTFKHGCEFGVLWYRAHGGSWDGSRGYDLDEVTHWLQPKLPLAGRPAAHARRGGCAGRRHPPTGRG